MGFPSYCHSHQLKPSLSRSQPFPPCSTCFLLKPSLDTIPYHISIHKPSPLKHFKHIDYPTLTVQPCSRMDRGSFFQIFSNSISLLASTSPTLISSSLDPYTVMSLVWLGTIIVKAAWHTLKLINSSCWEIRAVVDEKRQMIGS
jgi:hypothetical protein